MPAMKRNKTKYTEVYFIEKSSKNKKKERVYYIRYYKQGKRVEERAGSATKDGMTPAKANALRSQRMSGKAPTNDERRRQVAERRKAEEARPTLLRLWELYSRQREETRSLQTDRYRFEKHLEPIFGDLTPDEICTLQIDRLKLQLRKQGRAPQTVKHVLQLLKRLINFGVRKGLCTAPDTRRLLIEMPRVDNKRTEDLSPDQIRRLMRAIDEDDHPAAGTVMKLALFTGMRRMEMLKLKWQDIDFENNFITIRDPKGGTTERIPMNPVARELLENHHRTRSAYVFPDNNGNQRKQITREVKRIKDRAELPGDFRPLHGLRHVYASMLASSGKVDMYQLQRLLTHKSPIMTQRYAHLRDEALRRASDVASDIMSEITSEDTCSQDTKVVSINSAKGV